MSCRRFTSALLESLARKREAFLFLGPASLYPLMAEPPLLDLEMS